MNFGEMAWRPRLRQIGFAPKGEEWRCWFPGLNANAGEHWSEQVPLSLVDRWHMAQGYGYTRQLEIAMMDCDVYSIVHLDDLYRVVLSLPKPLAEILDDLKIPRTKTVNHFRALFGPLPEFHGPLEPSGLVPHGTSMGNNKELAVQPMFRHIENLPILGQMLSPSEWVEMLKKLVEPHPLSIKP